MARPIDEFVAAWEALSGRDGGAGGWLGIPVAPSGTCRILAARKFPGNEEALLVCFPSATLPASEKLPDGRGFEVARADPSGDGKTWLALSRKESGNPELFAEMAGDVAGAMDAEAGRGELHALKALLRRVRMWQQFMGRDGQPLGPEAELGLMGELTFLTALLDEGVSEEAALEGWVGPDDAPQDFILGDGAVEAKATLSTSGFPVRIGSLEQLDDSVLSPLFLAAARFSRAESGESLPEAVERLAGRFAPETGASALFRERVFAAGFLDAHASRYTRRFLIEETRCFLVAEGFPRITPGSVPEGVGKAQYEIDLNRASAHGVGLTQALEKLGVLK